VKTGSAGFTLLELLVVIAVLALAATLVVPRLSTATGASAFAAATERTLSELRLARSSAIQERREEFVTATRLSDLTGVDIETTPADGIRFSPDGSGSGGRVHLLDGGRQASIDVDWLTGRARISP